MEPVARAKTLEVSLLAITPDAQKVIEYAGRTCWQSFERIGADSSDTFIKRLIEMGHETPLEHACATFEIKNCSRAMTHQIVRHRLMSVCQQSQRYVEEDELDYVVPPAVSENDRQEFQNDMQAIAGMYARWRQKGLKKEDARFVLPNACTSNIVVTANFREWRHIFSVRLEKAAQWEIRTACQAMLDILRKHSAACFWDI